MHFARSNNGPAGSFCVAVARVHLEPAYEVLLLAMELEPQLVPQLASYAARQWLYRIAGIAAGSESDESR